MRSAEESIPVLYRLFVVLILKNLCWQKKAKEFGKQKSMENIDAEKYIASGDLRSKKKSRHSEK